MGFRNPITTAIDPVARQEASDAQAAAANAQASATNAITLAEDPLAQIPAGAILGSKLAADAIDGRTITGSTLRTAASGQRVQIDSTNGLVGYNAAGQAVTQVRNTDGALIATNALITGELDTGAAGTPRIRVYETIDGKGNPLGMIQLEDGVAGDTAAQIYAGGFGGLGGGGLTLSGGTYGNKKAAASLTLQTDQANLSTAQLTAPDGLLVNGQPWAQQRAWYFPRSANTPSPTSDSFAAGSFVGMLSATVNNAPAGDYLVTVTLVMSGAATSAGYLRFLVNGVNVSGDSRADVIGNPMPKSFSYAMNWAGGNLPLSALFQSGTQTATVWVAGSGIAVGYLGPRS